MNLVTLELSKLPDGTCYWIDQTEVTVAQYDRFLGSLGNAGVSWDQACVWKGTPSNPTDAGVGDAGVGLCVASALQESNPFDSMKPIRCVDWCDARAFCRWAGKDLCSGDTSDTIVTPLGLPDQWGGACSASGYPYINGSTPVYGACNVGLDAGQCLSILHQLTCQPIDVDSFPQCTSPSGAVDMIGNVAEWVLQCGDTPEGGPGADSPCQLRGGSFADNLDDATCYPVVSSSITFSYPRATLTRELGFRCCAGLTESESHLTKTEKRQTE